ncbi:MAG: hypothetical protein HYY18_03305 [Planctomycetes bacterium]|nr:hypothetical protein [Planctomycetota bacterium]
MRRAAEQQPGADRLLGLHVFRAADAVQLAAALVATYDQPARHEFVSLDARLAEAARRKGFMIQLALSR